MRKRKPFSRKAAYLLKVPLNSPEDKFIYQSVWENKALCLCGNITHMIGHFQSKNKKFFNFFQQKILCPDPLQTAPDTGFFWIASFDRDTIKSIFCVSFNEISVMVFPFVKQSLYVLIQ